MLNDPFIIEERRVIDLLVEAHNLFVKIPPYRTEHMNEWVDGIHKCQNVLKDRVVIRDYPHVFNREAVL